MLTVCPECGGDVSRSYHTFDVQIGRRSVSVSGEYERCMGECQEVYFAPGEMDAVMTHASDVIRRDEGLLSPDEIRMFRKRIGLTQQQFEDLLGAGPKTVTRWEKGTVIQNGAADTLLRVLRDVPAALAHLMFVRSIKTRASSVQVTQVAEFEYPASSGCVPQAVHESVTRTSDHDK